MREEGEHHWVTDPCGVTFVFSDWGTHREQKKEMKAIASLYDQYLCMNLGFSGFPLLES